MLVYLGVYYNQCTHCRQPQQMLLVSSAYATSFGRTGHLQALNTWNLKLKIKCIHTFWIC